MKKKAAALLICAAMAVSVGACANGGETGGTESTQSASETYSGTRSAQMTIDYEKVVPVLADYTGIKTSITGDYDVTDEQVESNLLSILPYYGITGVEVTDHDTVQEDDLVLIDYTGYKDGEAFDGGSATDVMFDVANNYDVTSQSSYIDGFADGLIGAKVGGTASSDVTFPENYSSEELAGQDATFEFTVKGIYKAVTLDNLTDAMVKDAFSEMDITTKDGLVEYVRTVLENQASNQKSQASMTAVEDYLLENCTVEIPDDYMDARMAEYEYGYVRDYCDTQTLEEYAEANSTTADDMRADWKDTLTKQIKIEFIFGYIAEKEDITFTDDEFDEFTAYLINQNSSQYADTESLYNYYGSDNTEDGEATLRRMYGVNQAIRYVVDNADITVTESTETEE